MVLGRSRWVDGAEVSQGGRCGEGERSVAFISLPKNSLEVSQVHCWGLLYG